MIWKIYYTNYDSLSLSLSILFLVSDTYTNNRDQKYTNLLKEITYFLTGGWRLRLLNRNGNWFISCLLVGDKSICLSHLYRRIKFKDKYEREWCIVHVIFLRSSGHKLTGLWAHSCLCVEHQDWTLRLQSLIRCIQELRIIVYRLLKRVLLVSDENRALLCGGLARSRSNAGKWRT